jgi:DNA-binding SARP family transcriptional activator
VDPKVFIRVLGPIDVVIAGSPAPITGRHTRLVLGALVVSLAHAVAAENLAFVVWGDEPPRTAMTTLQSLVSRLRTILGADAIAYTNGAYVLTADPDQVDAVRFERLALAAGDCLADDPGHTRDLCREALGLWRGAPFGDVGDHDFAHLEAIRLDELRMATMELQLEAELALHRERWVTSTLEAAVEEYPYREGLWVLLVRALVATNRRREAVTACSQLRHILAEIGLEPGPEILRLEQELFTPTESS